MVVAALRGGPAPELLKALSTHGSRVRLLPTRNLAVVLGGCNYDSIERVVSVTDETSRVLAEAGITSWAMHVDSLRVRAGKQVATK